MVGSVLVLGRLALFRVGRADRHLCGLVLRRLERAILERHVVGRPVLVELELHRPIVE